MEARRGQDAGFRHAPPFIQTPKTVLVALEYLEGEEGRGGPMLAAAACMASMEGPLEELAAAAAAPAAAPMVAAPMPAATPPSSKIMPCATQAKALMISIRQLR